MKKHTDADVAATLIRNSVDALDGCRVWTAGRAAKGYGGIRFRRRMEKAHRAAYEIFVGPIPDGAHVLHTCDNRLCIKPSHLFLGTNQDNILDKCLKDRSGKKLTVQKVAEMRREFFAGRTTQAALAKKFSVHQSNISRALRAKRWAHVSAQL